MRRKIAIFVLPGQRLTRAYQLRFVADVWRERGIEVDVRDDPANAVPADIAILHVDLTDVPPAYRSLGDRYPVVVNGRRSSVAKRTVSENLLLRGSAYDGPVIVKSNLNYAGVPEGRTQGHLLFGKTSRRRWFDRRLPRWLTGGVFATEYQIYDSLGDVPRVVWSLDRLVVEKFLPERRGGDYCIRYWKVLGNRYMSNALYAREPLVGSDTVIDRDYLDPTPDVLSTLFDWCRRFSVDYGKLDYAIVDGRPVLFDVNPTNGAPNNTDLAQRTGEILADGIEVFFNRARRATSDKST